MCEKSSMALGEKQVRMFELAGSRQKLHWISIFALFVFALGHIISTWGYTGLFWGDFGTWRHEVERFAQRGVPYVDFHWTYPPGAMWLLGGIARVVGTDVYTLWMLTSIVFLLIVAVYYRYASLLVPSGIVLPVVISGFALFVAYGIKVPVGDYTPAMPIGFLFQFTAIVLTLKLFDSGWMWRAVSVGLLCGMCVLIKHDFWVPSAYLVFVSCLILPMMYGKQGWHWAASMLIACAVVVLGGVFVVVQDAGWGTVWGIIDGFGRVAEYGGRGYPSWERLAVDVGMSSLLVLMVLLCLVVTRSVPLPRVGVLMGVLCTIAVFVCGLHIWMSYNIGVRLRAEGIGLLATPTEEHLYTQKIQGNWSLFRGSISWLKHRLLDGFFPVLLSGIIGVTVLVRWKKFESPQLRNAVLFLLGLCFAARLKSLFEHVEWYHFLLEAPVYTAAIFLFVPDSKMLKKGITLSLIGLIVVGIYTYRHKAVGPLSRHRVYPSIETPRGTFNWLARVAQDYKWLSEQVNRLDPSGNIPVFTLGYTGGINYFLLRRNPTPFTQGFMLTNFDPDKVIADVAAKEKRILLIGNRVYRNITVEVADFSLFRWENKYTQQLSIKANREYFEKLLQRYDVLGEPAKRGIFTIYNCVRRRQ